MREDLLALTADDLSMLSNRGTVKRAQAELDDADVQCLSLDDSKDNLTFIWSDQRTCKFPAKSPAQKAVCNCDTVGICRHIIRSILHLQRLQAAPALSETVVETAAEYTTQAPDADKVWNPGLIGNDKLLEASSKLRMSAANQLFKGGQTVELLLSVKPVARFLSLSHTVRFIVPGDVRYAVCDCRDQQPCSHALLAVLAFRLMPADKVWAVISTGQVQPLDLSILEDLEEAVGRFCLTGFRSKDAEALRLLRKSGNELESFHAYYLSELLEELLQHREQEQIGDALFDPAEVVTTIAELAARVDTLRFEKSPIPHSMVAGEKGNQPANISGIAMVGLGTQAIDKRKCISLVSYFQDTRSGAVVTMSRDHQKQGGYDSYFQLARKPFSRTFSLAALGVAHVQSNGGKLTASRSYQPGRSPMSVNPQAYKWESLRHPVLMDSFADLKNSLQEEFPRYLGVRQKGSSIKVCCIAERGQFGYLAARQEIVQQICDSQGNTAMLLIPYRTLAASAFEQLIGILQEPANKILFVAGIWSNRGGSLVVRPVTVVFEREGERFAIEADVQEPAAGKGQHSTGVLNLSTFSNSLPDLVTSVMTELGLLIVIGLSRVTKDNLVLLADLQKQCEDAGLILVAQNARRFLEIAHSAVGREMELAKAALTLSVVCLVTRESSY